MLWRTPARAARFATQPAAEPKNAPAPSNAARSASSSDTSQREKRKPSRASSASSLRLLSLGS